ncbi:Glycosyltransferase involved in cell wall bisynthesis [Evansella caseinilytica]|uniref:Glycosyltransferase involved in cell wall bisynthesis n=1 Tax=Evansella caseinilytica TaxID=1503961 RepID=A0A1H3HPY5_9BACI|nr:glycosyltransferase family 4 protein [Evansella caseinilytica]SDY16858.1 Glycosyltransferase involved in cell wall bisynthesis [Evansella caseinilytica]
MKVFHLGFGGQMIEMCQALREAGVDAVSCHMRNSVQQFQPDILFQIDKYPERERLHRIRKFMMDMSKKYDVFHFHFGQTFLPDRSDLAYLKKQGKKLIVQHRGSEVRRLSLAKKFNNPHVLVKKQFADEKKRRLFLKKLSRYIDHAIVADHELLPYIQNIYKHTHIIPQAINTTALKPAYPALDTEEPLIVHAPSNFEVKGTKDVLDAISRLHITNCRFKFMLLSNLPYEQALQIYRRADIIIDQLLIGSFGVVSLEAMALGKPVICYIRDDLLNRYPAHLPIVNANPDTIYPTLKKLLRNPRERKRLGVKGRKYAEKHHDPRLISQQLVEVYQRLYR